MQRLQNMNSIPLSKLVQNREGGISTFPYPPNVAGDMPKEFRQLLLRYMQKQYIWPQIVARKPYEDNWDDLLRMAKAQLDSGLLGLDKKSKQKAMRDKRVLEGQVRGDIAEVADTVIFDAIDRLTNLAHFIGFKEEMPGRFGMPPDFVDATAVPGYSKVNAAITSINCWLGFNCRTANLALEWLKSARAHYTYGLAFVHSDFNYEVGNDFHWNGSTGGETQVLKSIGVTFKPLSIRKVWLNPHLPMDEMHLQACPFFYDMTPRYAVQANKFDQKTNPFGYQNLDSLPSKQYLYGTPELQAMQDAFKIVNPKASFAALSGGFENELKWTLYPMLPIAYTPPVQSTPEQMAGMNEQDLQQLQNRKGTWVLDEDGSKGIEAKRYIVELFGANIVSGSVEIIRLQPNFYPDKLLPIFGSQHMPDCETGLYTSSIGDILRSHYQIICKTLGQYLTNKDLLNDPPKEILFNSPAMNKKVDLSSPSARIPVNSLGDIKTTDIADSTGTTPNVLNLMRDWAQTSSKAVDAILGKAMGARTSATEANNVFTTAMSGVTTDVNILTLMLFGGYAWRVWHYTTRFVDPDTLKAITGQYGFEISPEMRNLGMIVSCDAGSQFLERMTQISNIRYILEASRGEPSINRSELWRMLLEAYKFTNVADVVDDQGHRSQILLCNDQAQRSYLGELVVVDPGQDHALAIEIKLAYLKDRDSVWNTRADYREFGPQELIKQIQIHQLHLQMQEMQAMAQPQPPIQNGNPPRPAPILQG